MFSRQKRLTEVPSGFDTVETVARVDYTRRHQIGDLVFSTNLQPTNQESQNLNSEICSKFAQNVVPKFVVEIKKVVEN